MTKKAQAGAGAGVSPDELEALRAAVEALLPTYLADLERLVNIDCGSYSPDGVNAIADLADKYSFGEIRRYESPGRRQYPHHARPP